MSEVSRGQNENKHSLHVEGEVSKKTRKKVKRS